MGRDTGRAEWYVPMKVSKVVNIQVTGRMTFIMEKDSISMLTFLIKGHLRMVKNMAKVNWCFTEMMTMMMAMLAITFMKVLLFVTNLREKVRTHGQQAAAIIVATRKMTPMMGREKSMDQMGCFSTTETGKTTSNMEKGKNILAAN